MKNIVNKELLITFIFIAAFIIYFLILYAVPCRFGFVDTHNCYESFETIVISTIPTAAFLGSLHIIITGSWDISLFAHTQIIFIAGIIQYGFIGYIFAKVYCHFKK